MPERFFYLQSGCYICRMNMESLKFTLRDIVAIGGLIVTVVGLYFSVLSKIESNKAAQDLVNSDFQHRIENLERRVDKLETENARLQYDNIDTNAKPKKRVR